MWRESPGEEQMIDKLPFKTGDFFNFFQENLLYFTAKQVQSYIEHFKDELKSWASGLPNTALYDCFYDSCECDQNTMWDTVDTIFGLVFKFNGDKTVTPADVWEHTAYHAMRIAQVSAAPGFLFDIPADERPEGWVKDHTCITAAIKVLIAAVVDLREGEFFAKLLDVKLPAPKSRYRIHLDNNTAYKNWTGTSMDKSKNISVRPQPATETESDARKAKDRSANTKSK